MDIARDFIWGAAGLIVGAQLGCAALGPLFALVCGIALAAFCVGPGDQLAWSARAIVILVAGDWFVSAIGRALAD